MTPSHNDLLIVSLKKTPPPFISAWEQTVKSSRRYSRTLAPRRLMRATSLQSSLRDWARTAPWPGCQCLLACIIHAWSAAGPLSSVLTAFPTLGLLCRVDGYACASLGRKALSARRFRPFASTTSELCGLGSLYFVSQWGCPRADGFLSGLF